MISRRSGFKPAIQTPWRGVAMCPHSTIWVCWLKPFGHNVAEVVGIPRNCECEGGTFRPARVRRDTRGFRRCRGAARTVVLRGDPARTRPRDRGYGPDRAQHYSAKVACPAPCIDLHGYGFRRDYTIDACTWPADVAPLRLFTNR